MNRIYDIFDNSLPFSILNYVITSWKEEIGENNNPLISVNFVYWGNLALTTFLLVII